MSHRATSMSYVAKPVSNLRVPFNSVQPVGLSGARRTTLCKTDHH